jgi:hypothetical protein
MPRPTESSRRAVAVPDPFMADELADLFATVMLIDVLSPRISGGQAPGAAPNVARVNRSVEARPFGPERDSGS